jgi:predicted permease
MWASIRAFFWRLIHFARRSRSESSFESELEFHLHMEMSENLRRGMDAEEARRRALIAIGGLEQTKEEFRETLGIRFLDDLQQDLRYAGRMLRRNPGFTIVALVTLALGIGVNTAIFSVVNAVLLRPLPYEDPDSLLVIYEKDLRRGSTQSVSYFNFYNWREARHDFADMAAYSPGSFVLEQSGAKEIIVGASVSGSFFPTLGIRTAFGRTILPSDEQPGAALVAVLGDPFWRERLGSDPSAVGRSLKLNGQSYTIAGVLSPDFRPALPGLWNRELGSDRPQLWVSLGPERRSLTEGYSWLHVVGRTRPGIPFDRASAEMDRISSRLAKENRGPSGVAKSGVTVVPLRAEILSDVENPMKLLLGASCLVLLIACANVANLFFARALGREREFAVRALAGAGRMRLLRQQLTESGLLALMAGGISFLAVRWGIDLIVAACPRTIPRIEEISVDFRVFAFALGLSVMTGIVFGLAPAARAARLDLNSSLKQAHADGGKSRSRYRNALMVSEISLALVLTAEAGLLVNSFVRLMTLDPGFQRNNLLIFQLSLDQRAEGQAYPHEEILRQINALPQVVSSCTVGSLPLTGVAGSASFRAKSLLEQPPAVGLPDVIPDVDDARVSAGYFRTMGLQFLKGRAFAESGPDAQTELVVSESLADILWPGENAIGKRLHLGPRARPWMPVVGIVRDVRQHGLRQEPRLTLYRPYRGGGYFSIIVQTRSDPAGVISEIRGRILSVDKTALIRRVQRVEDILRESVDQPRFYSTLVGIFAVLGILLAAVGVYGIVSFSVGLRRREIGIRIALGARPREIIRTILGQAMTSAVLGLGAGLLLSLGLTRLLASLLFSIGPHDAPTLISVTVVMTCVTALAAFIPAIRATGRDPMESLRHE